MDRNKQHDELMVFANACVVVASVTKLFGEELMQRCKATGFKVDSYERSQWINLITSATRLHTLSMNAGRDNYEAYMKVVKLVKFIIKELIAKCDDSNYRLWQFHNLLKSYPNVRPELTPTYEEEIEAFANVLYSGDDEVINKQV